ncbi:hypothetical protein [Pedobacter sp. KACC 23697]|uniref:Uncharacterized protein n=1 Tax=Pedobacter sp. KACC 23697 TaxID=3149230 RepID=A0AAU7K4G4_9SPHI
MLDADYILLLFVVLAVIWAIIFIIAGQSWQLFGAFAPAAIVAYFFFDYHPMNCLLFLTVPSALVFNVSAVLSKPKFKGFVFYLNYLLILPLFALYLYYVPGMGKEASWLESIFYGFLQLFFVFFVGKLWISDPLLLLINQLMSRKNDHFETQIINRVIKGAGKSRSFYVNIRYLGAIEVSGFFYWYIRFKDIGPNDKVLVRVKTGWLGTEYIAGFPKLISRG